MERLHFQEPSNLPFFVKWLQLVIPRMIQVTLAWVVIFTATATMWWFLFNRNIIVNRLNLIENLYVAIGVVISFVVSLDFSSGIARFMNGASEFRKILFTSTEFSFRLQNILLSHFSVDRNNGNKDYKNIVKMDDQHTFHMKNAIEATRYYVAALPFTILVTFQNANLNPRIQREQLNYVLSQTIPPKYLNANGAFNSHYEPLAEKVKHTPVASAPGQIATTILEQMECLDQLGVFREPTEFHATKETIADITRRTSDLMSAMRISYPHGASNFITIVTAVYLLFIPIILLDPHLEVTLVLNALTVFAFAGLLEIGRAMREPFEDMNHNGYSDLEMRKWSLERIYENEYYFRTMIRRINAVYRINTATEDLLGPLAEYELSLELDSRNFFDLSWFSERIFGPFTPLLTGIQKRIQLVFLQNGTAMKDDFYQGVTLKLPKLAFPA